MSMALSFLVAASVIISEIDGVPFTHFYSIRISILNFIIFIGFSLLWYLVFDLSGAYYVRRLGRKKREIHSIIKITSLGSFMLLVVSVLCQITLVTPLFLMVFWFMTTSLAILSRMMVRVISRKSWVSGMNLRNAVIVGTNKRAVEFAQNLEQSPELGYRVMGFVDQIWKGSRQFQKSGYPLLADFQNFSTFLRTHAVDEVIVDLPLNTFYQEASYLVGLCVQQGIIVRFLSDSLYLLFDLKLARAELEEIQDYVILSVYTGAMGGWPILAKRAFDFLASFLLIILLSPLFLVVAFLIKLTSPAGPVFFVQDRIGLGKRTIKVIKFRTMVPGAEQGLTALERFNEASGPVFKIRNDPRVTGLGRFLRKTSIDELPQLFNVLRGDMSLVGPRPLPLRDYAGFSQDWHRRRFSVKPGITCLWQIYGRSSLSLPFEKWMQMDMDYIDRWSLGLDFKILAQTLPAIIHGRGAY
ncbi:MAG TPA: sugar transferase [Desulfobaccales bacterium]|nr:sugar transferase [Desulfobaccales bacterium]